MSALPNSIATSAADKEKLLALLRDSRQKFLASFAGVDEEECRCHPAPGKWSILDTVEHLSFAENAMIHLITKTRRPRAEGTPNREELFLSAVADRSQKLESPEMARPKGRFASLEEAAAQFQKAREDAMQFVVQSHEDLRATEVTHPHPVAGVVSTYEMLIIMAKHAERHALQIQEIRTALRGKQAKSSTH